MMNYDFLACGTATAISVPCMLSHHERINFEPGSGEYTENVLDIAKHAGYKVIWRENNTNCEDTCNRVKIEDFCYEKECFDDILLTNLADQAKASNEPTIVVMHQRGSHGPNYYERYPEEFKKYSPICETRDLKSCKKQELVNTYDNTIYYTSHILAKTIDELKKLEDEYNIAFLFTSDHGESLGENDIYLHSAAYDIAPSGQKRVPLMLWFSKGYIDENKINMECVNKLKTQPFSHDNIFHTVLGISNIENKYYNQKLDILSKCRK